MSDQPSFTEATKCGHCQNRTPMEIVFTYSGVRSHVDEDGGGPWDYGPVYELNKCPACEGIALRTYDWNESMDPGDATYSVLYPSNEKKLRGLPKKIDQGYQAAQRVRNIDPNAYGVLLGRVLDLVCEDRGATSGTLDQR